MIEELPVFEAWRDRRNLEIFASLNPKTPCKIWLLDHDMPPETANYHLKTTELKIVSGWQTVYARKLNWLDKLRSKLS